MPARSDVKWSPCLNRPISPLIVAILLLILFVIGPAIALTPRRAYMSIPLTSPGLNVSDGTYLHCSGHALGMGYPLVWLVDREVVWTIYQPPTPRPRPLSEADQKAEYVALRSAKLDPTRDAAELLFLAHPVDGSEILWVPAALNLLCALALLVAIERIYNWFRAFVTSRRPRPGFCIRCGYDLTSPLKNPLPAV